MSAARKQYQEGKHEWCPVAAQLVLPDVPEEHRPEAKKALAPYLKHVRVKPNECWAVAQALMLAARNPRIGYVEGVWNDASWMPGGECSCGCKRDDSPQPHAWNTVDGYLVDLSGEFWLKEYGTEWLHEPFKEYSLADLSRYHNEVQELDGLSITVTICFEKWAEWSKKRQ